MGRPFPGRLAGLLMPLLASALVGCAEAPWTGPCDPADPAPLLVMVAWPSGIAGPDPPYGFVVVPDHGQVLDLEMRRKQTPGDGAASTLRVDGLPDQEACSYVSLLGFYPAPGVADDGYRDTWTGDVAARGASPQAIDRLRDAIRTHFLGLAPDESMQDCEDGGHAVFQVHIDGASHRSGYDCQPNERFEAFRTEWRSFRDGLA